MARTPRETVEEFFERMGDPDERGPSASCSPTTRSSRSRERGLRGRTPRRRFSRSSKRYDERGQGVRPVDRRRRSRRQSGDPPRRRQRRRAVRGRAVRRRLRGLRGRDPPAGRVQRPRGRGWSRRERREQRGDCRPRRRSSSLRDEPALVVRAEQLGTRARGPRRDRGSRRSASWSAGRSTPSGSGSRRGSSTCSRGRRPRSRRRSRPSTRTRAAARSSGSASPTRASSRGSTARSSSAPPADGRVYRTGPPVPPGRPGGVRRGVLLAVADRVLGGVRAARARVDPDLQRRAGARQRPPDRTVRGRGGPNLYPDSQFKEAKGWLADGAARGDRDPASIDVAMYVLTAVDEDPRARASGRGRTHCLLPARHPGVLRPRRRGGGVRRRRRRGPGRPPSTDAGAERVETGLLDHLAAVVGTPEEARAQLDHLREIGVDLPIVRPPPGATGSGWSARWKRSRRRDESACCRGESVALCCRDEAIAPCRYVEGSEPLALTHRIMRLLVVLALVNMTKRIWEDLLTERDKQVISAAGYDKEGASSGVSRDGDEPNGPGHRHAAARGRRGRAHPQRSRGVSHRHGRGSRGTRSTTSSRSSSSPGTTRFRSRTPGSSRRATTTRTTRTSTSSSCPEEGRDGDQQVVRLRLLRDRPALAAGPRRPRLGDHRRELHERVRPRDRDRCPAERVQRRVATGVRVRPDRGEHKIALMDLWMKYAEVLERDEVESWVEGIDE